MSMVIANNMDATRALNVVDTNSDSLSKSLQKIASGMKIRGVRDGASDIQSLNKCASKFDLWIKQIQTPKIPIR
ncbi:MAG: hypothetical protein IJ575_03200 [Selenomonadaceae bacterium]|nr:hypothetical protein [Selenomonadaceae bacterium]